MVFGISNNNICISLKNYDWLPQFLKKHESGRNGLTVFQCNGNDMFDIYKTTQEAFSYSRKHGRPSVLVFNELVRRFGHAATDRQDAYYTAQEIQTRAEYNSLLLACHEAVAVGAISYQELHQDFVKLQQKVEECFNISVNEPKITSNESLVQSNSAPLVPLPAGFSEGADRISLTNARDLMIAPIKVKAKALEGGSSKKKKEALEAMRKHMTRCCDELLEHHPDCVYIGMHSVVL